MNYKPLAQALLATSFFTAAAFAAAQIAAGQYMVSLTPNIGEKGDDLIEKELKKISELKSVEVKPGDSSLHFTVKDNTKLDVARIADAVKKAVPGTTISEPIPESRF